ncbi:S8 family serine peptidase [Chryseobacterium nepalense]|uniref:S8 family serine peptidase n=1 Tax=Chryseobacterium nepalense TaxID=1854498 RepID=A0ABY4KBG7_9FLAO|nr:S8 family serine peptidase [Chryseobacterium nepalense]UPQ77610.1 S8 family serine peptidase [Chryseobacterium nepalense]
MWFYGAYDSRAQTFDEICYNNPYYLPVVSTGNSRNDTSSPGSVQIANKGGYDLIFGHGNAKNVMTVAAVSEVSNYVDESSVTMSTFSSWGPSDDGRIKPDISMKGVGVRSTLSTSNTATGLLSGTTMASPGITGIVLLLQQYYKQLYSNYMRSATVKGLILHTADEAGYWAGPDYEYGWELVNAEKAVIAIRDKNSATSTKKRT